MFRTTLLTAAAAAALSATAALAAPGGSPGAPSGAGMGHADGVGMGAGSMGGPAGAALDARLNSMGSANASSTGIMNADPNSVLNPNLSGSGNPALGVSQGPNHASATGIANANSNSVLAGTSATSKVVTGALAGLTTGMTLFSNGTAVGTVQQIRTNASGSVVVVLVQGTNGRLFAVPAGKLTLANGTLTTMARLNGINNVAMTNPALGHSQGLMHASPTGIAHANSHSVLAAGAVASTVLPGLATGMMVQTSTGTSLGTVTQIVTDSSGNIRLVIVTSSTGQTFRLAPSSLTISGGVLTTTQIGG